MASSVSKVIFDALVERRSVVLSGVGSLEVKRRKAKQISETRIIPPQNVVTFTADEVADADSVASLMISSEDISKKDAKAAYESWLAGARTEGGIIIDGVGEIKDGRFVATEPLHAALNPANEEDIVTMENERKSCPLWAWVVIGVLLAVLVFGVLWCWNQGLFSRNADFAQGDEIVVSGPEKPSDDEFYIGDQYNDMGEIEYSGDMNIGVAGVAGAAEAGAVTPSGHRFHVIAGSFAVDGNADKLISKIRKSYPELSLEKIVNPRNGYSMVSISSAPTERQAYNEMNRYWDIDLYLWVYEQN